MIRPTSHPKGPYELKPDGLYVKEGKTKRRIAPYIRVIALGKAADGDLWVAQITFENEDDRKRSLIVPKSFLKRPDTLLDQLDNAGYDTPADREDRNLLKTYLATARPKRRFIIVRQPGWVGKNFVLPKRTIGHTKKVFRLEPVDASRLASFDRAGSLEDWQQHVAEPCATSTRLSFAICVALAAPLLKFVEVENGFFHFTSGSSIGKTTLMIVARSVCGLAARNSLFNWNFTATGIEEAAVGHNYTVLCLDELGVLDLDPHRASKAAREIAFKIASGSRRLRSKNYDRQVGAGEVRWRLFGLSSGEQSIGELADAASVKRLRGEQLRLIDVPAQVHPAWGIFETLPSGCSGSKELVEALERHCATHYGVAFPAFIEKVVAHHDQVEAEVRALMKKFRAIAVVSDDPWEQRLSDRFALAYAAGIMGIRYGILPWKQSVVEEACVSCYQGARRLVPDTDRMLADGMERLVQRLTSNRVLDLSKPEDPDEEALKKASGFKRKQNGQILFGIKPPRFREWFDSEIQGKLVLQHLDSRGLLVRGARTTTKQQKYRGIGRKRRYYCIRAAVLKEA